MRSRHAMLLPKSAEIAEREGQRERKRERAERERENRCVLTIGQPILKAAKLGTEEHHPEFDSRRLLGWMAHPPNTAPPRQREPLTWVHHKVPPVALGSALTGRGRHRLRPETPHHYDKGRQDVHIVPDVVVFQFLAPIHPHSVARQIEARVAIPRDDVALQHLVPEPG